MIELTAKESTFKGKDCVYKDIGNIGTSIMSEDVQVLTSQRTLHVSQTSLASNVLASTLV